MWFVFVGTALAYETDQLTHRARPLADETSRANALLQPLLDDAIARTNRRTRCEGDDGTVRKRLAREIHRATSRSAWVWRRGLFRAPGFTRYSASLERSDAKRFDFADREDVYGEMTLMQSVILTLAGPCSTYAIGGQRIGTDKLDHFLDVGWVYYERIQRGATEREVLERGAATERRFYGLFTSKTFSFADLKANWDGYRFYTALLDEGSAFQRDETGCVQQVREWDWNEWVGPRWDEVLEPNVHTPIVQRRLVRTLESRRERICAEREAWDATGQRAQRMQHLDDEVAWVRGRVPLRQDVLMLAELCDPERDEPLTLERRGFVRR